MADNFNIFDSDLSSPGKNAYNVTPSDGADLSFTSRALYVGTSGNINVIMAGDTANTTFTNVQNGTTLPIRVKKVWTTGTTASNIVCIY